MRQVVASMSELVRVGGWALRGAGFPFGVAERGTRMLAWTEAVHGGAIADICAYGTGTDQTQRRGTHHYRRAPSGVWEIDAAGKHLIELGPPAADLVTSDARSSGTGAARLSGCVGLVFVSALASLLADRGLLAFFQHASFQGETPAQRWLLAGPGPSGPRFASGVPGDALEHALRACLGWLPHVEPGDGGSLFMTACMPSEDGAPAIEAAWERCLTAGAQTHYSERVAEVYRQGVTMPLADLQELYELEIRTWAPTSERSRSQAGYGAYRPS